MLEYEYTVPWRATALYPSSGPLLGGTFVQVLGTGMTLTLTLTLTPTGIRA
jgi:hypothetical protein